MRNIIILFVLMIACASSQAQSFDSCAYYRRQRDTARHKLYMANQQINAAFFYIKLCAPSKNAKINKQHMQNRKLFFYPWIVNRAMVKNPVMDASDPTN